MNHIERKTSIESLDFSIDLDIEPKIIKVHQFFSRVRIVIYFYFP